MSHLCVLAPEFGAPSESFIRRHACDLAPGETLAVSLQRRPSPTAFWTVAGEVVLAERTATRLWQLAWQAAARRCGRDYGTPASALASLLRRRRPAVVLIEYLHVAQRYVDACKQAGVRAFAHGHGWDIYRLARDPGTPLGRSLQSLEQFDGLIVPSRHAERTLRSLGIDRVPIHVCPYGTTLPATTGSPHATRPPGAEAGTVAVVAIGRLVAKKAPILLVEAFRRARTQVPNLRLDLVGDGPLAPAVADFVDVCGLTDSVRLHGALPHDQTLQLLSGADLFIQHSIEDPATGDCEGVPVAIIEAMAHGKPVVTTRHSGIPEIVTHDSEGLLSDERDCDAMAEFIVALAGDPGRRERLGAAARHFAERRLSWESNRDRLRTILGLDPR